MFTATPPPLGSKIEQVVHGGVSKYFWREKDSLARYPLAMFMSLPVLVYVIIIWKIASQAVQGPPNWNLIAILFFFISGVFPLSKLIWLMVRPAVPESITLDLRSLHYDSGVAPINLMDPGLQRLRVDVGAERVEIGKSLTEPEREWLYGVLKQWQKG